MGESYQGLDDPDTEHYEARQAEHKTNLPEVEPLERRWDIAALERTCQCVPSEWMAKVEISNLVREPLPPIIYAVYIRYRYGRFAVGISMDGMSAAVSDARLSPLIEWFNPDPEAQYDGSMNDMDMLHLISSHFNTDPWVLSLGA